MIDAIIMRVYTEMEEIAVAHPLTASHLLSRSVAVVKEKSLFLYSLDATERERRTEVMKEQNENICFKSQKRRAVGDYLWLKMTRNSLPWITMIWR